MKRIFITILFLLLLIPIFAHSQELPESRLVNQFGKGCSEIISRDYDYFLAELQKLPNSKGYIIFNGEDSNEGTNIKYINHLAKNYPAFRGFNSDRIVFVREKNLNKMKVEFWIVPMGAKPPEIENLFQPKAISSTTRFQKTYAGLSKFPDSNEHFVNSFYEFEGCDFAPNLQDFAEVLKNDENLTGYLIVYGSKNQSKKKIKTFALKQLVNKFNVPKKRLKTIYGENQEESEIELWFVPKGEKPPIADKS